MHLKIHLKYHSFFFVFLLESFIELIFFHKILSYRYALNLCIVSSEMPIASNEEWRARIGSSWCALGRPFKRRNRKCPPSDSGDVVQLSSHQFLYLMTMIILLTQTIWVTVTFSKLRIGDHDRLMYAFPTRGNLLLLCHINVYACMHVGEELFGYTATKLPGTSQSISYMWANNNNLLYHDGSQMISTLASMTFVAVIHSLLLRAGDVEQNPGPGKCSTLYSSGSPCSGGFVSYTTHIFH